MDRRGWVFAFAFAFAFVFVFVSLCIYLHFVGGRTGGGCSEETGVGFELQLLKDFQKHQTFAPHVLCGWVEGG